MAKKKIYCISCGKPIASGEMCADCWDYPPDFLTRRLKQLYYRLRFALAAITLAANKG